MDGRFHIYIPDKLIWKTELAIAVVQIITGQITVPPSLSKILEKGIHNQLYYFFNANKAITSKQFTFLAKAIN